MILLAFLQIVLRNVFAAGLTWGDLFLRNLVLWIGFIGAAIATREGKHIHIDVVSKRLSSLGKRTVNIILHLFSFLICGLLTYAALKFILNEAEMGGATFFNLPVWIPQIILPVIFAVMTFRFGLRLLKSFSRIGKIETMNEEEKRI